MIGEKEIWKFQIPVRKAEREMDQPVPRHMMICTTDRADCVQCVRRESWEYKTSRGRSLASRGCGRGKGASIYDVRTEGEGGLAQKKM